MCGESVDPISYEDRLKSFKNWNGQVDAKSLASAGFYYIQEGDICRCVHCNIEIFKWRREDCPIEEHFKYAPHCDVAKSTKFLKTLITISGLYILVSTMINGGRVVP